DTRGSGAEKVVQQQLFRPEIQLYISVINATRETKKVVLVIQTRSGRAPPCLSSGVFADTVGHYEKPKTRWSQTPFSSTRNHCNDPSSCNAVHLYSHKSLHLRQENAMLACYCCLKVRTKTRRFPCASTPHQYAAALSASNAP
ncbi:unnamed protein product, partial [Laminaria digitata]